MHGWYFDINGIAGVLTKHKMHYTSAKDIKSWHIYCLLQYTTLIYVNTWHAAEKEREWRGRERESFQKRESMESTNLKMDYSWKKMYGAQFGFLQTVHCYKK